MKGQALGSGGQLRCILLSVVVFLLVAGVGNVRAQEESPAAAGSTSELNEMLARVPAELPELEEPEQATISYADFALQLETVGVPAPTSMEDEGFSEWRLAVLGLRAPRLPIEFPDEFRADFGFDLLQAEQTLEISNLPFNLTLYRGGFDQDAITASLQELGYRPVAIEGATVFGVREDFESDLGGPMGYAGSFLNYAAFLEDGTLALAPARSIIAAVVAVDAGEAPSLAEDRNVAALLDAAPTDLASALLVPGAQLGGGLPPDASVFDPNATPDLDAIETTTAQQAQMPPIRLALLGLTPGGPLGQIDLRDEDSPQLAPDAPRARAFIGLALAGPAAAEDAVPIIEERLATGVSVSREEPFAEVFPDREVDAVPGEPIVTIELSLGDRVFPYSLWQLFDRHDLSFLAWV